MLDVFVVATLVILLRFGGIAQIAIKDGLVLFTCAVLLAQLAALLDSGVDRAGRTRT